MKHPNPEVGPRWLRIEPDGVYQVRDCYEEGVLVGRVSEPADMDEVRFFVVCKDGVRTQPLDTATEAEKLRRRLDSDEVGLAQVCGPHSVEARFYNPDEHRPDVPWLFDPAVDAL